MRQFKDNQNCVHNMKNESLAKKNQSNKFLLMDNTTLSTIIFYCKIWLYSMEAFSYFL